jgi:hypothetical protein
MREMAVRPETILFGASQQRMFIFWENPQTVRLLQSASISKMLLAKISQIAYQPRPSLGFGPGS